MLFFGTFPLRRSRFFSSRVALKNRSTIFTLGNRGNVLTSELEEPIIVPHAAQKNDRKVVFIVAYFIIREKFPYFLTADFK